MKEGSTKWKRSVNAKPILCEGSIQRSMTSGAGLSTKLKLLSRAENSHVRVVISSRGLLCCHAVKVLDFLGIDQIPAKHILKRWKKDARDILPDHLVHLQKDKISVTSITFRHTNLYTHALEVVRLGDANILHMIVQWIS